MGFASNSCSTKVELIVERGEPTLVCPAEDTKKGIYYLSNLDQIVQLNVPTVYCFKSEKKGNEEAAEVIKNALSKLLVPYYPLAGRFALDSEGKLVVDCNGEGAVFVEAEANCTIEEIGDDTVSLGKLILDAPDCENVLQELPLVVQLGSVWSGKK